MKLTLPLLTTLPLAPLAALHAAEALVPDGIEHVRVERSASDRCQFLHDPAVEFHEGKLSAAWNNCPEQEIVGESLIRGRRSEDGGRTWGGLEVIVSDTSGDGTYHVPAQLLSHGGVLHAFVGTMKGGHDLLKSCAVYVLDEASNRWQPRGEIADLFLPNCQPIQLDDGNWIMAAHGASRSSTRSRSRPRNCMPVTFPRESAMRSLACQRKARRASRAAKRWRSRSAAPANSPPGRRGGCGPALRPIHRRTSTIPAPSNTGVASL